MAELEQRLSLFASSDKVQRYHELEKYIKAECAEREHIEWTRRFREMDFMQLNRITPETTTVEWKPERPWELEDRELQGQLWKLSEELRIDFRKAFPDNFHYLTIRVSTKFINDFMKNNRWCTHEPTSFPELQPYLDKHQIRPYDVLILESNEYDENFNKDKDKELKPLLRQHYFHTDADVNNYLVIFNHPKGLLLDWDDRGAHFSQGFVADFFNQYGLNIYEANRLYHQFEITFVYGIGLKKEEVLAIFDALSDERVDLSVTSNTRYKMKDFNLIALPEFNDKSWLITSPVINYHLMDLPRLEELQTKTSQFDDFLSKQGVKIKAEFYRLGFSFD